MTAIGSKLAAALVKAQAEFPVIPKNSSVTIKTNAGSYSYSYADLNDVKAATKEILKNNGLAVSQFPSSDEAGRHTLVTYIVHESGDSLSHSMLLIGVTPDPKTQGTAITYARRYAYCAALGIVADEDVDAPPPAPPEPSAEDLERDALVRKALDTAKWVKDNDQNGTYTGIITGAAEAVQLTVGHWIKADPASALKLIEETAATLKTVLDQDAAAEAPQDKPKRTKPGAAVKTNAEATRTTNETVAAVKETFPGATEEDEPSG